MLESSYKKHIDTIENFLKNCYLKTIPIPKKIPPDNKLSASFKWRGYKVYLKKEGEWEVMAAYQRNKILGILKYKFRFYDDRMFIDYSVGYSEEGLSD